MGCEFSKLYNLEIHLENDLGIFEPLDVVAGHVLIQVENDTSIHHCFLTLRGLAHFSFANDAQTSNSSNNISYFNNTNNTSYVGQTEKSFSDFSTKQSKTSLSTDSSGICEKFQILLMQTEDLLLQYKTNDDVNTINSGDCSLDNVSQMNGMILGNTSKNQNNNAVDGAEFIITKGLHVFNFEFQLPGDLPASFVVPDHVPESVGMKAFVVYNIKVEVVNVVHQVSHSRERDILLFRSLDLTQYPKLKDKVTLRKEFFVSECCAPKSKLLCELTVNKCAFVPGEIMRVEVSVKNGSTKPIESVQLSLLQNVTTRSEKVEKTIQLRLFSIGMGSVSPHRAHNFTDSIHVPPVVASGLKGCEIIDVNYYLFAQLFVFGDKSKKKDLYLKIPITIGSDPIKDASFGDNKEVVPCYALFDYDTGAVIEYVPLKVTSSVHHMMPVYRYYKPAPPPPIQPLTSHRLVKQSQSMSGSRLPLNSSSTNFSINNNSNIDNRPNTLYSPDFIGQKRIVPETNPFTPATQIDDGDSQNNHLPRPTSGPIIIPNDYIQFNVHNKSMPPSYPMATIDNYHQYSLNNLDFNSVINNSSVLLSGSTTSEESTSPHSCTSVERFHCHDLKTNEKFPSPSEFMQVTPSDPLLINNNSMDITSHYDPSFIMMEPMKSNQYNNLPISTLSVSSGCSSIINNSRNENKIHLNNNNKLFSYYLSEESSDIAESNW